MNCPSCGKQVQQDDSFCMHCGAFLANPAQSAAGAEPLPATPVEPPWQAAPEFEGEAEPGRGAALPRAAEVNPRDDEAAWASPSEARPSSSGRWLGLLALLLVLFGLAAAGGYLVQRTVFRANEDQAGEAGTSQPLQPAEESAALESAPSEPRPAVDPNTPDSLSEVPAQSPADSPAQSSASAGVAGAHSSPAAVGGGQAASIPNKPSASAGAATSQGTPTSQSKPQGTATSQSQLGASSAGQAVKTAPAAKPSATAAGAIHSLGAAKQPRPESQQKAAAQAPIASETAATSGIAQPQTAGPAETTIAAAAETAVPAPLPRSPRSEVFRPDAQPPRPAASQPQSASSATAGAPSAPAPPAPEEGIIYWTGRLTKNQVIVIERGKATIGMADGGLPATPVDVWLPSPAVTLVERPTSQNNWSRVAFRCLQSTNRNVTLNIQWKRLR
jgi:hypothetical protein